MNVTSLLENTTKCSAMQTEHGLSLYIETKTKKILFDMGQTSLFLENARKLDIELSAVDFAVLSHGHYDHGGGLPDFLRINDHAPVYISRFAFEPYYNRKDKYIGLDLRILQKEEFRKRIRFTGDEQEIADGIRLFSCNSYNRPYGMRNFGLSKKIDGHVLHDDFRHEQYLRIEEDGKTVLFSGCSHKGIMNIVSWFSPDILIGGFHFSSLAPGNELEYAANVLNTYPTVYYTCHCTGTEQYKFMSERMNNLHYLGCGERVKIISL